MYAALAVGVMQGGMALANFIGERKKQRKIRKAIADFKRQDLVNPYENMKISTMGSDIMREDNARMASMAMAQAQEAGGRSAARIAGSVQQNSNEVSRQIALNQDNQIQNRDRLIADQEAEFTRMKESRDIAQMEGLGQALNVSNANKVNSMNSFGNAIGNMASLYDASNASAPQMQNNPANNYAANNYGFQGENIVPEGFNFYNDVQLPKQ